MLYGILRLASCLSRTVLSHHSERILQLYTEDLDGEKGTSSVLHSRNTFFFFMSASIFSVETTCNVLELGHYVIRNLWIVFSHVTTFLSGALLVHITCIKTTKTTTVQRGDNEGFYGRFLAVGRPVSVLRNFYDKNTSSPIQAR